MPAELRTFLLSLTLVVVIFVSIINSITLIKAKSEVNDLYNRQTQLEAQLVCYQSHGAWMSGGCH